MKPSRAGVAGDPVLADLDPGMRGDVAILSGDTEAQPAGDAAPAQHGVRGQRARQTKRVHPRPRADALDRPRNPVGFVGRETAEAPRRTIRPGEDARGRNKTHARAAPG